MPTKSEQLEEETKPLTRGMPSSPRRGSSASFSSVSTTSIVLERLNHSSGHVEDSTTSPMAGEGNGHAPGYWDKEGERSEIDLEDGPFRSLSIKPTERKVKRMMWLFGSAALSGWVVALLILVWTQAYQHASSIPHDLAATTSRGSGKEITLDQVLGGQWRGKKQDISWIAGANGEDGLLLEKGGSGDKDYLLVEDVRSRSGQKSAEAHESKTLMKSRDFDVGSKRFFPDDVWPSADLSHVLVVAAKKKNWRHSYTGTYAIFDVDTQTGEALDPKVADARVQLASWSPKSDAIVFTKDNNLFLRKLNSKSVTQITKDGGVELFYGVPDWVYEEEVFSGNSATWWAEDGKFIAFLRTNESTVPEYPIQYFVSRPSGKNPPQGEENYPEVRDIKYPKAGAPNPVVDLQFYDVDKQEVFSVEIDGDFPDDDRLITEVVWAGSSGKVLVRETNRESDILRVVLIDVKKRSGKVVRTVDVNALDKGWFEVSEDTRYIPADAANGRPQDGYIDTIIQDGYDHLAYFSPMESANPVNLTSGPWEVVSAPSAVDLKKNLVYFVSTKESPGQRQVYSVKLDGTDMKPITNVDEEAYYSASFSKGAGFALLNYDGPNIPSQRVISTLGGGDQYEDVLEDNKALASLAAKHELPIEIYSTVDVDGFTLQVIERRPPHFSPDRRYPVLFHLYGGPGSQTVDKKWNVDFQAYVAANLEYIVVTVDGRGTGFIGREARCIVRGNIGYYEARDQIETAKIWAQKDYVDESRIAIWGWSYGGFLTLKTLEQDGGQTFKYGMAVAPVTDWKYYDTIYTERYMHTPQHNPEGYHNASINNMTALGSNVRFLMMHGVADDNVHLQNSLTLLDNLDLASVENYDVHIFPDSDHSIYFHNANRMVYDRLSNWLVNAFNGEWLRTEDAIPKINVNAPSKRKR